MKEIEKAKLEKAKEKEKEEATVILKDN